MWDLLPIASSEKSTIPDGLWRDSSGVRLEPGPAIFYLAGEDGEHEEELDPATFAPLPIREQQAEIKKPSHLNVKKEEPMDISLTLEELKAHGLRMEDILSIDDHENDSFDDKAFLKSSKPKSLSLVSNDRMTCYVCKKCDGSETLAGYESVVNHMLVHHCDPQNHYSCSLCDSELSKESSLKKHVRNVHFRMEAFECPVCRKEIQQRSHLKQHVENVHGGGQALSKVLKAARSFLKSSPGFWKKALKNNGVEVHGYGKVLTTSTNVNKLAAHDGKTDKTCKLCHKMFTNKESRDRHLAAQHKVEQDEAIDRKGHVSLSALMSQVIKCKACSILCTSKLHLVLHMREVHRFGEETRASNKSAVTTVCPICNAECGDPEAKRRHLLSCHDGLKEFPCTMCQEAFHSKCHLEAHCLHCHPTAATRDSPIKCDRCEFTVRKSERLLSHVEEMHPYQCPECPNHFRRGLDLEDHYVKAHVSGDLTCGTCGTCFGTKGELKQHRATHKREQSEEDEDVDVEASSPPVNGAKLSPASESRKFLLSGEEKEIDRDVLDAVKTEISNTFGSKGPNEDQLQCNFCRNTETYGDAGALLDHVLAEHPYRCVHCPEKMVKFPSSMRKHFRVYHPGEVAFFCRCCTAVFNDHRKCRDHVECKHGKTYQRRRRRRRRRSSFSEEDGSVQQQPPADSDVPESGLCITCQVDFDSLLALSEHVAEAHQYACPICQREYKLPDSIRKHCRNYHTDRHFPSIACCKFCPSVFLSLSEKRDHLAKMHNVTFANGANEASSPRKPTSSPLTSASPPKTDSGIVSDRAAGTHESHEDDNDDRHEDSSTSVSKSPSPSKRKRSNSSPNPKLTNADGAAEETGAYKCPKCPKFYSIAKSLRKHCSKNHNTKVSFCKPCLKVFTIPKLYKAHVSGNGCESRATAQSGDSKQSQTPSPVAILSSRSSFITPIASNKEQSKPTSVLDTLKAYPKLSIKNKSEDGAVLCPDCGSLLKSSGIENHMMEAHGWNEAFTCDGCATIFPAEDERKSHVVDCEETSKKSKMNTVTNYFSRIPASSERIVLSNEDVTIPEAYVETTEPPNRPRSASPGEFHGFWPPSQVGMDESLGEFLTNHQQVE